MSDQDDPMVRLTTAIEGLNRAIATLREHTERLERESERRRACSCERVIGFVILAALFALSLTLYYCYQTEIQKERIQARAVLQLGPDIMLRGAASSDPEFRNMAAGLAQLAALAALPNSGRPVRIPRGGELRLPCDDRLPVLIGAAGGGKLSLTPVTTPTEAATSKCKLVLVEVPNPSVTVLWPSCAAPDAAACTAAAPVVCTRAGVFDVEFKIDNGAKYQLTIPGC